MLFLQGKGAGSFYKWKHRLQLSDTTKLQHHDIPVGMSCVKGSDVLNLTPEERDSRHCSKENFMIQRRSLYAVIASAGVALAFLTGAGAAQAGAGVSWSVGIGAPGMAVGVASPQPYYYAPAPVYYAPPTYYAPPPPPVYYRPARPVYYAPPVVVAPPTLYFRGGYRPGHGGPRGHGARHWR